MQDPSAFGMMMGLGGVVEEEHEKVRCPRCSSDNTKFCYYNNYNMSQPRHYCKACRRYWTKGGALRNIPVGGSSRNSNKRSSSSSSSSASSSKRASSSSSSSSSSSHTGGSGNNHQLGSTDHLPPNGMLSVGPIQNGNMPSWSPPPTATGNTTTNVCPDLAIYTPHSTFQ